MRFALPLIDEYSFKVQLGVLLALLATSYLHRNARIAIAALTSAYLAFKILPLLWGWAFYILKGIAMLGFFITYFKIGVGFIMIGFDWVLSRTEEFLEAVRKDLDKKDESREEKSEQAKEKEKKGGKRTKGYR